MSVGHPTHEPGYENRKGRLNSFAQQHLSSYSAHLQTPFPLDWRARLPQLVVGISAIPAVVRTMVPVVVASGVGTVVLAIVPAVIRIPVQLVVHTDMRARVPIVVPAGMPVVFAGPIPSLVIIVMGARRPCECREHCRCGQHQNSARDAPLSRLELGNHCCLHNASETDRNSRRILSPE